MEIRKVRKDEYENLLELMNLAFNFKEEKEKFEHILPKIYYKDNDSMIHIAAFEENKMVASIGLYPMNLISNTGTLKVACLGGVSTHPDYRNKGYFSKLIQQIIKEGKDQNYDMLFLGGMRSRYGHYGFENCGLQFVYGMNYRSKELLDSKEYTIKEMEKCDNNVVQACLDLYNLEKQHVDRKLENFINHTKSWNQVPYVVFNNSNVIGYFTICDSKVNELIYKDGYKDTILQAILSMRDNYYVITSMSEYNDDTLSKCEWYRVENDEMAYIYNLDNVAKYLDCPKDYKKYLEGFDSKKIIRTLMGDGVSDSLLGNSFFIFFNDRA